MGDDMATLLQKLGHTQVDALGYSMGGGVAFRLAVQHPALVRRLAIVSAGYAPMEAILRMKKIDIAELQRAYDGG